MTESSALLSCPFCQQAVQFRKALHVSDGNVDSIIHAAPSNCPMVVFEDESVDESILIKWNTRGAPAAENLADILQNVRTGIAKLPDRGGTGYPIELYKACHSLEHLTKIKG